MESRGRAALEVMTILVTWRAVMRQTRAGQIANSSEAARRATLEALAMLAGVADAHRGEPLALRDDLGRLLALARAEVQGALHGDLADSGEEAG